MDNLDYYKSLKIRIPEYAHEKLDSLFSELKSANLNEQDERIQIKWLCDIFIFKLMK